MKKYNVNFCYPTYYYTTVKAKNKQEAYEKAFDEVCSSDLNDWEIGKNYLNYEIEEV